MYVMLGIGIGIAAGLIVGKQFKKHETKTLSA